MSESQPTRRLTHWMKSQLTVKDIRLAPLKFGRVIKRLMLGETFKPDPVGLLRPVPSGIANFGPNTILCLDQAKPHPQFWLIINIPPNITRCYHSYPEKSLCGWRLHRPHFTCLSCPIRRVLQGKIPNMLRIRLCLVQKLPPNHPQVSVRVLILKKLWTIAEFFTH